MKGSIRVRVLKKTNTKVYDALYRTSTGQRSRMFTRKKDAERFLSETVTRVHRDTYQDLKPVTFTTFATTWIDSLGNLKPSTIESYRSVLAHFVSEFGERPLHTLTVTDVNRYLAQRAETCTPKTARNELAVLNKILGDAQEAGHLFRHPLTRSRALRRPKAVEADEEHEVEIFDPGEIEALLQAVEPYWVPYILTGVLTGLRPGELVGLHWGDIDWTKRVLNIRRTFRKGVEYVLKTKRSKRSIDIGDQLVGTLRQLARERFGNEDALELEQPIFVTLERTRIDVNNFRTRVWMPALVAAGLAYRKPYSLRHSFATLLLAEGQSVAYISAQLGHSSPVMTLNVYAKFLPRERRDAPARLEGLLAAARAESPTGPVMQHHATDPAAQTPDGETNRTS